MTPILVELLQELNRREIALFAAEAWISALEKQLADHGIGFPGVRPQTVTINVGGQ